jgi:putative tryptophan/tyrosine transport system substrate-binding protein
MNEKSWLQARNSRSDNLKSKTCPESYRRIQNRKLVTTIVVGVTFALCGAVAAAQQPKKVPTIGYLSGGDPSNPEPGVKAFRQGLLDLGYIEGKNILLESRYAEGQNNRMASLVAELVQLKVDVLVSPVGPAIRAAQQATKIIPIVMVASGDPVATGYVDSLARPGRNITGVTRLTRDLGGKRLELIKELVPAMSSVGVLWSTTDGLRTNVQNYEAAARALKIPLQSLEVHSPNPDFDGAFREAAKRGSNALITVRNSLLSRYQKRIADLAIKNRLPSMFEGIDYVEAGGLMSYAANDAERYGRAAWYVDKILKGAKPADLPVEQPTKFEFAINLKTAKALNLTIPQSVLFRADKVIK